MRWLQKLTVAVIGSALIVSGCGGNAKSDVKEDGKINLRFASWDVAEAIDSQQKLVDEFNKAHNDIEVTLEAYGADFDTKISAGMGSGDTPDIMYMWNYPAYYEGLEPLDKFIEKEGRAYQENFYETLWNYNSIEKQIYGVPVGFTTHVLFYNKDLFSEAQVKEPTADWTWDDLEEAAKTITDKTDAKGFAFQMKPDPYDYEMYLWGNGTAYCNEEGELKGNLNSEQSKEVFEMFQTMEKEGYAVATENNGTDEFRSGTAAMYVYGAWSVNDLNEDGMNYGMVEIPAFKGADHDSVSILSTSGIAMSKDCENKEAAWEFIKFWTDENASKQRIGSEMPALYSVVESEKLMENQEFAPFYKMLEQSEGYIPASFVIQDWSEVSENLSLSFEEIFNPSVMKDAGEVLDGAVR